MFDIEDIESSLDMQDIHPFENVLLQECLLSNKLIQKILNDVKELRMGLNGELTMTKNMERLGTDLAVDMVPLDWSKISYPTQRSLPSWLMDLKLRIDQLKDCVGRGLQLPMVTWISGLFNPVSFLTAVLQTHARATNTEFDRLTTSTEVLKRQITDISSQAKEGNYLTGLYLEGARWDVMANNIVASYPKQMFCKMPVVLVKAAVASTDTSANVQVQRQTYMCPVYRTTRRCETFVFTANLKTKAPPAKWVMAGVALLMDVEG
jgi:dynein heavy chain